VSPYPNVRHGGLEATIIELDADGGNTLKFSFQKMSTLYVVAHPC